MASGHDPGPTAGPLELISDAELAALNHLLPWHAFVIDGRGRRLGDTAWAGKRVEAQVVPDPRVLDMDQRFGLGDKIVLEIGCFEGVHTIALCQRAAGVIAIDARAENVVKTLARAAMFDCWPKAYIVDVEDRNADKSRLAADLAHHVGVLYHLQDPVAHLMDLGQYVRRGLMLDTHVATDEQATSCYTSSGGEWRYWRYGESGRLDPFSGMYGHAKWLALEDLELALRTAGFPRVEIVERREERNGLRVRLFAERQGLAQAGSHSLSLSKAGP